MKNAKTFICDHCDRELPISEKVTFDGADLCLHCLRENTVICTRCGERIWNDDNEGTTATPLCQSCYDRHYTNCSRCGALLHINDTCYASDDEDEEQPYCHNCFT